MKRFWEDIKTFLECKSYVITMVVIAIVAYGFAITHHSIGMDDTAVSLYFEDGLAPYVGRWTLYVLNKVLNISSFLPWVVEFLSVFILVFSATLWCVLWKRVSKKDLPIWKYVFVGGIFISCPLISEVFVFYLHNGICIGYGLIALALLYFVNALEESVWNKRWKWMLISVLLSTVAIGCYESFAAVFVIGAITCYLLVRTSAVKGMAINSRIPRNMWNWLFAGVISLGLCMLFRLIVLEFIKLFVDESKFSGYSVLYRSAFGEVFTQPGELSMIIKRFWALYYVNGIAYLPVTVLVMAIGGCICYTIWWSVSRKDIGAILSTMTMIVFPLFMSILEGNVTRYRSAQYVPVVCAFSVLLLLQIIENIKVSRVKWVVYLGLLVLIINQCIDMNKWFWIDYLKYQDAKRVMEQVAYDIESSCDISKPIVFRGGYKVPNSIREKAYVSFGSKEHQRISKFLDPIDVHLQEKYWDPLGYNFVEGPNISILQWGVTAFNGTSQQLIEFWRMHGIGKLYCATDLVMIEEAQNVMTENNMPGYPQKGYIQEFDDYIIVNLSHSE